MREAPGAAPDETRDGWTPQRLGAARTLMRRYGDDHQLVATCLNVTRAQLDLALNDLLGRTPEAAFAAILAREARMGRTDGVVDQVRALLAPLGLTVVEAGGEADR